LFSSGTGNSVPSTLLRMVSLSNHYRSIRFQQNRKPTNSAGSPNAINAFSPDGVFPTNLGRIPKYLTRGLAADTPSPHHYSVKVRTMDVIARSETTKQSPGFGRFEIAAAAFGLLAMTTPQISLDGVLCRPTSLRIHYSIFTHLAPGTALSIAQKTALTSILWNCGFAKSSKLPNDV